MYMKTKQTDKSKQASFKKHVDMYKLDKEEQMLLQDFENGALEIVADKANETSLAMKAAKNALTKSKKISIRLAPTDLHKIKGRAVEEGMPYQTLITSLIHKYAYRQPIMTYT